MSPMVDMVADMEVDKLADMKVADIYMLLTCIMVLSHVMCMEVYWSSAWIKWQLDF